MQQEQFLCHQPLGIVVPPWTIRGLSRPSRCHPSPDTRPRTAAEERGEGLDWKMTSSRHEKFTLSPGRARGWRCHWTVFHRPQCSSDPTTTWQQTSEASLSCPLRTGHLGTTTGYKCTSQIIRWQELPTATDHLFVFRAWLWWGRLRSGLSSSRRLHSMRDTARRLQQWRCSSASCETGASVFKVNVGPHIQT